MKYAWVCAHCGTEALFTNKLPERGNILLSTDWQDFAGLIPTKLECPSCYKGLIPSSAYLRTPQEKNPQAAAKQSEGEGPDLPAWPGDTH